MTDSRRLLRNGDRRSAEYCWPPAGARTALLVFGGVLGMVALMLTLSRAVRTIPSLSDVAAEQTV